MHAIACSTNPWGTAEMANHRHPSHGRDKPPRRPHPPRPPHIHDEDASPGVGPERLQKILAHAGVGSRRACEDLILQGRVTIDGKVVRELGTRVDPQRARIDVDGQRIQLERPVYFAVNKPKGYVSTNRDPSGRPRVIDLLPEVPQRVYSVGRLDEMSVGLMILTNDGELAHKLAHPKYGVEKVYRAVVAGKPTREVLDKIVEGVWLAEGKARAKHVRIAGHQGEATILEMVLAEGKNREVRRMLAKLGHKVMSLTRVAVGPVSLRGLKPGEFRPLSGHEVDLLRKVAAGIPVSAGRRALAEDRRPTGRGHHQARQAPGPGGPPRPPHTHDRRPAGPAARAPGAPTRRPGPAGGPRPRPPQPPGPAPLGPRRPQRPPRLEPPTRKIIGLDAGPGDVPQGGIRPRRVGPRRRPMPTGPEPPPLPRPPRLKRPRRPRPGDGPAEDATS
jgi:23S rRNA pseudouridine2605 synthase